ncbi:MAG: hypothetical protein JST42_03860 [Bacteroidetes bacterium]|nr:hypothetical protein [Bacteroidota bacterium]
MPTTTVRPGVVYPRAHWYFALAIVVTWVGFSTTYFTRLKDNDIFHHIHGASAGLWMTLLIIQPILYQRGRLRLHRRLGKWASIVLVPLLVLGGIKMIHTMVRNADHYPPGVAYQLAWLDCCMLLTFLLFFGLAIFYGRNLHYHARYMACTVLVLLPPALTRACFFVPWIRSFARALNVSFIIIELVLLLLMLDDRRYGGVKRPYVVAFFVFAAVHLSGDFAGQWSWWRGVMG